jgi:sugar/nucleoside kinase (ribokinase family)
MVPAYPVDEVCDPTGAGDSFAGGFMGMLASKRMPGDRTVREALLTASVVASFAVEDFSVNGMHKVTRTDIDNRLHKLKKMMSVE